MGQLPRPENLRPDAEPQDCAKCRQRLGDDHLLVDVLEYSPLAWGQLPYIALADKKRIIGAETPVPPSKVFDADLGCPLCWQEVKSKDLWTALLEATNADFVVGLGAGSGIAARSCLALGIPWVGLCWNEVHAHWLSNVVDRWAFEETAQKTSPPARAGPVEARERALLGRAAADQGPRQNERGFHG